MHPILFHIAGHAVPTFSVMLTVAMLAAVALAMHHARRYDVPFPVSLRLALLTLVIGVMGSRAIDLVVHPRIYLDRPLALITPGEGGGAFYGGLLAVLPLYYVYCRRHAIPHFAALDVAALVLPLGQAIGRWGCLAAGCCHGVATDLPWGVRIDSTAVEPSLRGVTVHPTQIYESLAQLVVFAILARHMKKRAFDGQIACLYAFLYAPIRFAIEFVRGDSIRGFVFSGLLSTSQIISIGLFTAALILYPRLAKRGPAFAPIR